MVWTFNTKIVGISFGDRQKHVPKVQPGFRLFWIHEEDNEYDPNAILIFADPQHKRELGHLKKEIAEKFVKRKEQGIHQDIIAEQVTGQSKEKTYGLNVKVVVYEDDEDEE